MKIYLFAILVLLSAACHSAEEHSVQSDPYTGSISADKLLHDYPHFRAGYLRYKPKLEEIKAAQALSGKSILVLFGTWCHDSEREVPRLIKLLETAKVALAQFSLHGLDYNKQEPANLHLKYALKYSPTIILLDGKTELGRVVEKPDVSLGEDLASFLTE